MRKQTKKVRAWRKVGGRVLLYPTVEVVCPKVVIVMHSYRKPLWFRIMLLWWGVGLWEEELLMEIIHP